MKAKVPGALSENCYALLGDQKIVVMGFVAGLIALPLGLLVGIIITVIYSLKKNSKENELSTTKMILSSLGVLFISTLIAIPSVFYLLFLMYSAAT
ncbi:MAG: hypothetical protein V7670_07305 [Maribacter arcticus]|uniref:hypothetical protein n=1 Tax=Maribacter arcticus TaxID=561365 RepID=UPI003001E250